MHTRINVPLGPLTTLRLGGLANRLVEIDREQDVVDAVRSAESCGEPIFVLGRGSNVVVADDGFAGLVVHIAMRGVDVRKGPDHVVVQAAAGEDWDGLVARSVDEEWCGIESMSGIPGLVGATPIQNVGAYGQEVREVITGVRAYDRIARAFVDMGPRECQFAYRTSVFKRSDRWIVTGVRFELGFGRDGVVRYPELAGALSVPTGASAPSHVVRKTVMALRRAKGMVVDGDDPDSVSVGSFFVNPIVDAATVASVTARAGTAPPSFEAGGGLHKIAAAWLVEQAGFVKGWGTGQVGVSRKHALALVNRGGATTGDLLALARAIRDGVRARFGVTLDVEPVLLGCSWEEGSL
ncbi:MAG: UDP-N-acetylmuramate dehydrogenase [Myxococcota bacterium]|nr:UDP-N-acetylmuramate dehydrogenase [Myxococcota bacterium]